MFRRIAVRVLVLLAVCAPWFNIVRDNADSAGMLAHLHGMFVDVDLLYDDEYRALGVTPTFAFVTGQGVVSNHWPAGATWLQAPGYGLGLLAARVLEATGLRLNPYGAVPLLAVRTLAMLVLAFVLRAIGRAYAHVGGTRAAWLAVTAWAVGTPLLFYASEAPLRPHLWGFAVMTGLVLAWRDTRWGSPLSRAVVLGTTVGLAASIRPQLAVIWLLVAEDVWRDAAPGRVRRLGVAALAAAVWPLLHLRMQLWMYGPGLGDYAGQTTHHLRAFLFSPYHGALTWSPILGVGLLALVWAVVGRRRAAWLLAALFVHQIWLDCGMRDIAEFSVLGTRTWSGGTSFGARKLLDAAPLLLPATLELVAALRERPMAARSLAAAVLATCVPSVLLYCAAFVDPGTTGALLDWRGLGVVLERPLSLAAWGAAAAAREVPWKVWGTIVMVVALPCALASVRLERALERARPVARTGLIAALLVGGGVAAQLWLSVAMVRSDLALAEDPQRMAVARAAMHPAHRAAVSRIPARHATLRALLGEHAAPATTAR